jgi:uncharacterized protein YfaQ (DUF2300 family)
MTVLAAIALSLAAAPPGGDLSLAWRREGRVVTRPAPGTAVPERTPLGSLWKLFVYAYAVERGAPTPDYRCGVPRRPGEEYCCEPGQSVERDAALARSCGHFFEPGRLGIDADSWREFWSERTDAAWLHDLGALRPETSVSVPDLLRALDAVPTLARAAASRALLPVVIDGYGQGSAAHLGGLLRVKTFTWKHPRRPGATIGGAAGWLVDGTPLWLAATGSSRSVLREGAEQIASWLPAPAGPPVDDACVVVDYFERYPIRAVDELPARAPAPAGPLHGRYRVGFENGNTLAFTARGELRLDREGPRPRIRGRLGLAEYVARVLDREADPTATAAARALAVVARTWLLQNAAFEGGCFGVKDSTRAQRVSPSPASALAREAALFTDGLVLQGQPVQYRREPAAGTLAWTTALAQAREGWGFDAILASAFPRASLGAATGERECRRLGDVETWLARATPRWRRALAAEPGFEPPAEAMTVCAVEHGPPYADRARARIYMRGLVRQEDRITLAHEYVHLAFRFHPRGGDEEYVERLARALADR